MQRPSLNLPGKTAWAWIMAACSAMIYLLVGFYILVRGHLHEDAYILFIYAENLAQTGRITYFLDGPVAEGATDFLWMLLIAFLNRMGIDSGSAVVLLNATGVFLISLLANVYLLRILGLSYVAVAVSVLIPATSFAIAGYAGFSTPLYAAMVLSLFLLSYQGSPRTMLLIPSLGLLLGLFRPDGVIIGVVASVLGWFVCPREYRRRYLLAALIAVAIGLTYFLWRWWYFGYLLPLPLYVKSDSEYLLPGMGFNHEWAKENLAFLAAALGYILLFARDRLRLVLALLPVAALLAALLVAVQTQNVAFRFQAPATVVLFFLTVLFVAHLKTALPWHRLSSAAFFVVFLGLVLWLGMQQARDVGEQVRYATNDDYINFFPFHVRQLFDSDTVFALTEAGRAAYWMPGRKYDLVGLNTAHPAIQGVDRDYLNRIAPDILFFHVAGTVAHQCPDGDFCNVAPDEFRRLIEGTGYEDYAQKRIRIFRAPLAAYAFLEERLSEYEVFFVRYAPGFSHVYALRNDGPIDRQGFQEALALSFAEEGRLSYWEMRHGDQFHAR